MRTHDGIICSGCNQLFKYVIDYKNHIKRLFMGSDKQKDEKPIEYLRWG